MPAGRIEDAPPDWLDRLIALVPNAIIVASLLAGGGAVVWHAVEAADVRAFEARATEVTATVVEREGGDWVLQFGDGRWRLASPDFFALEPGMEVGLLVDPLEPGHAAYLAQPRDPSWLIGVAALTPVGVAVGLRLRRHRRRSEALLKHGGPARRVLLRDRGSGVYAVFAPDAPGGPAFRITNPELVHLPPDRPTLFGYAPLRPWEGPGDADESEAEDDTEPDAGPLDAAELAEAADELQRDHADEDDGERPTGPVLRRDVTATLVGALVQDGPVLLRLEDGRAYLGALRITVPAWLTDADAPPPDRPALVAVRAVAGVVAAPVIFLRDLWDDVVDFAEDPFRHDERLMVWVRANGRALRWLVLPLSAVLGWVGTLLIALLASEWRPDGSSFKATFIFFLGLLAPAAMSAWFGVGAVERDELGFRVRGMLLDRVVSPGQVLGVAAGRHALGVELARSVLSLRPDHFYRDRPADADAAALLVEGWLARAAASGRGGWRPTPALWSTLLLLGWWAGAAASSVP